MLWSQIFIVQNHFIENRFELKIFWLKISYGCKIISLKTGFIRKCSPIIFGRQCFFVAKSFPRKEVWTKKFHEQFFVGWILWWKNISSKTGWNQKFSTTTLWSKFFMVAQDVPQKQVLTKNYPEKFLVENFYGCKMICSELDLK